MAVNISNSTITMTRGDTLKVKVNIFDSEGKPYIPVEGDKIRFAVKRNYYDEKPLILKEIPFDTLLLQLEPKDTKDLKQPSELKYDIQITMNDGTVDTFIKGILNISEEVY